MPIQTVSPSMTAYQCASSSDIGSDKSFWTPSAHGGCPRSSVKWTNGMSITTIYSNNRKSFLQPPTPNAPSNPPNVQSDPSSCGIFNQFLDSGYQSRLLTLLSDDSEPITPSQTTLLKLLDSHLASSSRLDTRPSPSSFLISFFHHLASYAVGSLRSGQDDSRLPKVLEGLILTCEALSSIGLAVQSRIDKGQQKKKARVDMGGDEDVVVEMKDAQKGVINPLISQFISNTIRCVTSLRQSSTSTPSRHFHAPSQTWSKTCCPSHTRTIGSNVLTKTEHCPITGYTHL